MADLLGPTAAIDVFVNPLGCQAVADSVGRIVAQGWSVWPAARMESLFKGAPRSLHAKFLFSCRSAPGKTATCRAVWVYLGSGNLTGPGFAHRMSRDGGNLEAGVIFAPRGLTWPVDGREDARAVTRKLPIQRTQCFAPTDKLAIGSDMPAPGDAFVAPPVAWLAWSALEKGGLLTLGNGHGIAALIDQVRLDADKDRLQMEEDARLAGLSAASPAPGRPDKRMQRSAWWRDVISAAFSSDGDPLYSHPALLTAVNATEAVTGDGEKVLVFGRFTRPLQALVHLLNARQLLRMLDAGGSWPQAKVHADEWTALQAAHWQLGRAGTLDRAALDDALASQYRKQESRRDAYRASLLDAIDTDLPHSGRARQVFDVLHQATRGAAGETENPLVLLARAMQALTADETRRDTRPGAVFAELIDTACRRGDEDGDDVDVDVDVDDDDDDDDDTLDASKAIALWKTLRERLEEEFKHPRGGFARLMYGGITPQTRQYLQLAFNRAGSHPQVLVAQSMVGREGLNLHRACKTVVLLHPEWNPGVVEQQIGRVDRVGSLREKQMEELLGNGAVGDQWPRILVRPVVFRGTYDERNWEVLRERWDELRAQLHGVAISPRLAEAYGIEPALVDEINGAAPCFSPSRGQADLLPLRR